MAEVTFQINDGLAEQISQMINEPDLTKACKKAIAKYHSMQHDNVESQLEEAKKLINLVLNNELESQHIIALRNFVKPQG